MAGDGRINAAGQREGDRGVGSQFEDRAVDKSYFYIARTYAEKIPKNSEKCYRMLQIAIEWSRINDLTDAWETLVAAQEAADLIIRPDDKARARKNIESIEGQIRAAVAADPSRDSTTSPALLHPGILVWLARLNDDNSDPTKWKSILGDECPLDTELFLDLRGYLAGLPPSGVPQKLFDTHSTIAWRMVRAQNVIDQMIKD